MELFTVIRASAFRALKPRLFEPIVPLELITAVKQKYDFLKAPDANLNQPVDFQAGKLRRKDGNTTSIEQFVVAYVGNRLTSLGAATRVSTDSSEEFLEDLIRWAGSEYKLDTKPVRPRAYFSQVEFVLSKPLSDHFLDLQEIGQSITNLVKGYGLEECPLFEFGGFSMHYDVAKYEDLKPNPQAFAIERRVGSTYDERKYFSQAPLRTQDHKTVLVQLEKILTR
jgi:hypothetical protein